MAPRSAYRSMARELYVPAVVLAVTGGLLAVGLAIGFAWGQGTEPDAVSGRWRFGLAAAVAGWTVLAVFLTRRIRRAADALERSAAEARAARDRAETCLAHAGILIVTLDPDARVSQINREARETLGYSEDEIIGGNWFDSFVAEDQRDETRERFGRAVSDGADPTDSIEISVRAKSGAVRLLSCEQTVIRDADGRVTGMLCAGQDVTERRQAERTRVTLQDQFRAILDHSPSAIFLKDLDGRFLFANREFAHRGRVAMENVPGKTDADFLDAEHARRLRESDKRIIETGRTEEIEMSMETPEGIKTIQSLRFPILDLDGRIIGIGGIGTDVTERKRTEAQAKKLQSELAHVLRIGTVGEMATGLAHELNQPLTAIKNYTTGMVRRLQSGGAKPEDMMRILEIVGDQAQRAGGIVRGIRNLVQREEGELRDTDINAAVHEVAGLLTSEALSRDITIETDLDETLPTILADAVQIQQVVLNLARNGMDSMSEGLPDENRRLTLRSGRDGHDTVLISVGDTGPGIPEGIRRHIFDPFFTTRKAGQGMGMGLPICRTIVEAHAGKLWFTTETGKGTTFHVALPTYPATQDEPPQTELPI